MRKIVALIILTITTSISCSTTKNLKNGVLVYSEFFPDSFSSKAIKTGYDSIFVFEYDKYLFLGKSGELPDSSQTKYNEDSSQYKFNYYSGKLLTVYSVFKNKEKYGLQIFNDSIHYVVDFEQELKSMHFGDLALLIDTTKLIKRVSELNGDKIIKYTYPGEMGSYTFAYNKDKAIDGFDWLDMNNEKLSKDLCTIIFNDGDSTRNQKNGKLYQNYDLHTVRKVPMLKKTSIDLLIRQYELYKNELPR